MAAPVLFTRTGKCSSGCVNTLPFRGSGMVNAGSGESLPVHAYSTIWKDLLLLAPQKKVSDFPDALQLTKRVPERSPNRMRAATSIEALPVLYRRRDPSKVESEKSMLRDFFVHF